MDRSTLELSVLGYSVLPVFCMAADGSQPKDKSDARVCINAGGFQLPLWPTYPPSSGPLRAAALQSRPRLPCTSILLRIMTPAEARPLRYALNLVISSVLILEGARNEKEGLYIEAAPHVELQLTAYKT